MEPEGQLARPDGAEAGPWYWFPGGGDGLCPAFYWDRNEGPLLLFNDAVEFRADQSGMDTIWPTYRYTIWMPTPT